MHSTDAQWTVLVAHPGSQRDPVAGIAVEVRLASPTTLLCSYSLHGEIARVRLAGRGTGTTGNLWQHTCFEAFLAAPGVPGYYEFNFSPSLSWAAYWFSDYRDGKTPATLAHAPGLHVKRSTDRLELMATVHLTGLASLPEGGPLRIALATVVEDELGKLSYWALEHPPGKPDFHHPDGFAIELRSP